MDVFFDVFFFYSGFHNYLSVFLATDALKDVVTKKNFLHFILFNYFIFGGHKSFIPLYIWNISFQFSQ